MNKYVFFRQCGAEADIPKYETGCLEVSINTVFVIVGSSIIMLFLQCLGIIFACYIGHKLEHSPYLPL